MAVTASAPSAALPDTRAGYCVAAPTAAAAAGAVTGRAVIPLVPADATACHGCEAVGGGP